jgi:hypothetical protein
MAHIEYMSNVSLQTKCNNFGHLPPRQALIEYSKCYSFSVVKEVEWRSIPGFDNYLISSSGQIKNLKSYGGKPRVLVPTLRFNKYFYVTLKSSSGKRIGVAIDRLIVSTFNEIPLLHVRKVFHFDNIKFNNRIENLDFTKW